MSATISDPCSETLRASEFIKASWLDNETPHRPIKHRATPTYACIKPYPDIYLIAWHLSKQVEARE